MDDAGRIKQPTPRKQEKWGIEGDTRRKNGADNRNKQNQQHHDNKQKKINKQLKVPPKRP